VSWWLSYYEGEINDWARKLYYRKTYLAIIPGVQHVEFGNADSTETAIKNLIAVDENEMFTLGQFNRDEISVALISSGR
jgi:hypothetical protein